jgi:hypothetical protein
MIVILIGDEARGMQSFQSKWLDVVGAQGRFFWAGLVCVSMITTSDDGLGSCVVARGACISLSTVAVAVAMWVSHAAGVLLSMLVPMLASLLLPLPCCAGEVMATNFLLVKAKTEQKQLAGAIAARMRQESHTVLECYGAAAVTNAIYVSAVAAPDAGTSATHSLALSD